MTLIPDTYEYQGNDGVTYKGTAAYVLNHIDSAHASARDNFPDLFDGTFDDDDIREEVRLHDAFAYLIDHPSDVAAYL